MDNAQELAQKLDEYRLEIIDIAEQAKDVIDADDIGDPEKQLDVIENRLAAFARLKKKYGGTLEDVIALLEVENKKAVEEEHYHHHHHDEHEHHQEHGEAVIPASEEGAFISI